MNKLSQNSHLTGIVILVCFLFCSGLIAQNPSAIDSLRQELFSSKEDSNRVKLLLQIGEQFLNTMPDSATSYFKDALTVAESLDSKNLIAQALITLGSNTGSLDESLGYLERALKISEETGNKQNISTCYLNLGIQHHDRGTYDLAIDYYLKSLEAATEAGFKKGMALSFTTLGNVHFDQGLYKESLEYYLKALNLNEELGQKRGMAVCNNNIGLIHYAQGSYQKSIGYYHTALKIHEEMGNKRSVAICYNNIGNAFNRQDSADLAISYYQKSLSVFEMLNNKKGISGSYINIGEVHSKRGEYDEAKSCYLKALKLYEEIGDKWGIALAGLSVANLNLLQSGQDSISTKMKSDYLDKAISYASKSLENAEEMKLLPTIKEAVDVLMKAHLKKGDYKRAMVYAQKYISVQDTMFKQDITRSIQEMSAKYETEKKQQQIDLQASQLAAKDAKIKQQKILRNALFGGSAGTIVIIIVIVIAYIQKKRDNKKITFQKESIQKASEELRKLYEITSSQKEEIVSSIHYAERIQSAILPPRTIINELLNEYFIFHKPKEIVSGDFYWIRKIENFTVLAVADCTGHGVPGAMMSMLGMSYLNEIVNNNSSFEANQILNELRNKIISSLRQQGKIAEPKDGIDLSLCIIDERNKQLQFSGAMNPVYIIRKNGSEPVLEEIKGDPMPVGVHFSQETSFSNHLLQLENGDLFYLFSDGYYDQNGGKNNHRFTSARFKNLLFEIHKHPMTDQMEILDKTLREWMGDYPQRDDILVMGVKV